MARIIQNCPYSVNRFFALKIQCWFVCRFNTQNAGFTDNKKAVVAKQRLFQRKSLA
ncbi:hypothetical protein RNAN_1669 [Rheinheimera nanhaiensis E407-8]|uniref:Uncharacterized protein n=1 Tax=Rheinheimera nanhaiensis E407-8 TaxID=562729 RepID=I1DXB1_9GAMM|nr:hypothetical protein RNAN_1669 [Rheinheimera nanhaiensis E407-8]